MTKRQFVVLVFRLFALYLLFTLIPQIGFYINNFITYGTRGFSTTIYIEAAVGIGIDLAILTLLWNGSEWLMQKIFATPVLSDNQTVIEKELPITSQSEDAKKYSVNVETTRAYYDSELSRKSIELILFSGIGLWTIFHQLPQIAKDSDFVFGVTNDITSPFATLFREGFIRERLVEDLIPIVFGLWLFLRPWQFQGWIEKFKPKAIVAKESAS